MVRWRVVLHREHLDEKGNVVDNIQATKIMTEQEVKKAQIGSDGIINALRSKLFGAYLEILSWTAESPV